MEPLFGSENEKKIVAYEPDTDFVLGVCILVLLEATSVGSDGLGNAFGDDTATCDSAMAAGFAEESAC